MLRRDDDGCLVVVVVAAADIATVPQSVAITDSNGGGDCNDRPPANGITSAANCEEFSFQSLHKALGRTFIEDMQNRRRRAEETASAETAVAGCEGDAELVERSGT